MSARWERGVDAILNMLSNYPRLMMTRARYYVVYDGESLTIAVLLVGRARGTRAVLGAGRHDVLDRIACENDAWTILIPVPPGGCPRGWERLRFFCARASSCAPEAYKRMRAEGGVA